MERLLQIKTLLIGAMILMLCTIAGTTNACVQIADGGETYTVDQSGCVD